MCVTMWREKALAGRRLLLELRLLFPQKADSRTCLGLRTQTDLLTLLSPSFFFFFLLSQVDLHYFPAHCLKTNETDRFSWCLNVGEEVKRRGTGRLHAPRRSAA